MKQLIYYVKWFILFLILVAADQFTKQLAIVSLKGNSGISIIKNVFKLFYLENHGAAFGVFQEQRIPLLIVTVLVLIFICYIFYRIPHEIKITAIKWILVILAAGAVGNMIDRIYNGYVVDFLYFELINFPVFNVADCYVVVGAILAVILIIFYYDDNDLNRILKKQ